MNAQVFGTLCMQFITPEEFKQIEALCALPLENLPQELKDKLQYLGLEDFDERNFEVDYNKDTQCVYFSLDEELGAPAMLAAYGWFLLGMLDKDDSHFFQWAIAEGSEVEVGVCNISKDSCVVLYGDNLKEYSSTIID